MDYHYVLTEIPHSEAVDRKKSAHAFLVDFLQLAHPKSNLFQSGTGLDYLGMPEDTLKTLSFTTTIESQDIETFANVDLRSRLLPVVVQGTVSSELPLAPDELNVVITLNGVVEGVSRLWDTDGTPKFYSVLPESSLKQGRNDIGVYLVRAKGQNIGPN